MAEQDHPGATKPSASGRRAFHIDRRILLLALIAFIVLFPASWWGVPHAIDNTTVRGWDVDGVGGIAVLSELNNLLTAHRPDWYVAYPVFHYLLLAIVYVPYFGFLLATGQFSHPTGQYPFGFEHPTAAIAILSLLAHAVTLVMAIGTVILAYLTGLALWDRRAATLGALVLLLTIPFAFYARTSNLDIPVLFWTAGTLLLSVHATNSGLSKRLALGIGITAALAVATKDQAYAIVAPVVLYVIVLSARARPERGDSGAPPEARPQWKNIALLITVGAATFAIGGALIISPSRFVRHVQSITHFRETFSNITYHAALTVIRPPTLTGYALLFRDCVFAVATALGPPAAVAGLAGLALIGMTRTHRRAALVLVLSLFGFFVLTLVPIRFIQYRYALFPAFIIALCAGALWSRMLSGPPVARALGRAWIVVALLFAGWGEADLTWQMLDDARYAASDWFASTALPGDSVAYFGKQHQLLYIPAGVMPVELDQDAHAEDRLCSDHIKFVYVAPDYFTDPTHQHSTFLPDSTYSKLLDGRLGFHRVFRGATPGLWRGALAYLPYVNPPVQIFALNARPTCAHRNAAPRPNRVALIPAVRSASAVNTTNYASVR